MHNKKVKILLGLVSLLTFIMPPTNVFGAAINNQVVDSKKVWKVKFTQEIGLDSAIKQGIIVKDSKENIISVDTIIGQDKKSVIINPPTAGYILNEQYTLNIGSLLQSKEGKKLNKSKTLNFTAKNTIDSKVLFEYSYTNYAWGYAKNGFFIDGEGNVKGYKISSQALWKDGNSKETVQSNYSKATAAIEKINLEELNEKQGIIKAVKADKFSDRKHVASDMGSYAYYCYLWDEKNQVYNKILLSETGDWESSNLNPDAMKLDSWLKGLIKE